MLSGVEDCFSGSEQLCSGAADLGIRGKIASFWWLAGGWLTPRAPPDKLVKQCGPQHLS